MNVRKLVSLGEQEVDVAISAEDIAAALLEEPEMPRMVMVGLNNVGQYLKAVTPEMIAGMNEAQRKCVRDFLVKQADRYLP